MKKSNTRPKIETIQTPAEMRRWYWLKDELIAEARRVGLKTSGAKFTILDRICHHRNTGKKPWPGDMAAKASSKFDWHSEPLSASTVITDSYRNTQNVRRWFTENIDPAFKFNIAFMEWIKKNCGKTLGNAGVEFLRQKEAAAQPGYKTEIKPHNQFNQYTRDFLADNPELGMEDVRRIWALKRQLPSEDGRHIYQPGDLHLKTNGK